MPEASDFQDLIRRARAGDEDAAAGPVPRRERRSRDRRARASEWPGREGFSP
jgi:hypothetical protein